MHNATFFSMSLNVTIQTLGGEERPAKQQANAGNKPRGRSVSERGTRYLEEGLDLHGELCAKTLHVASPVGGSRLLGLGQALKGMRLHGPAGGTQ